MPNSKWLAGIIGPTIIVMVSSELKSINPNLYETQIIPLVYLSGLLFFVAGLSIVRAHNYWGLSWHLIITLSGWFAIALGAFRMFAPQLYKDNYDNDSFFLILELLLIAIGVFLTFKAYWKSNQD
jgi:hypothetical protein